MGVALVHMNPKLTGRYTLEASPFKPGPYHDLMRAALRGSGIPEG